MKCLTVLALCVSVPAYAQVPILVSRTPSGQPGNGISQSSVVSSTGRYVGFTSTSSNLVPGDDTNVDLFRFDRDTNEVLRAQLPRTPRTATALFTGGISADGRFSVFSSTDGTLVPGDTNGVGDVFVYDWSSGATTLVSRTAAGLPADGESAAPTMSADGNRVAFSTRATNLSPLNNGLAEDVFLWERATGTLSLVTRGVSGAPANGFSVYGQINPSGTLIAFSSAATNLTASADTNGVRDIYVYEVATGHIMRASIAVTGAEPNGECINGVPSDGGLVLFHCAASNLVPGDTNGVDDVFVAHLVSGEIARVSIATSGVQATASSSFFPLSISSGGRRVAFAAGDPMLDPVGNDTGTFLRQRDVALTTLVAPVAASMSADGRAFTYSWNGTAASLQVLLKPLDLAPDLAGSDEDGDGLPTGWETSFGLNPTVAAGGHGSGDDPDGDGLTNAQEFAAQSHPRGLHTRYLAEGASSDFFTTRIALANVGSAPASVLLRFLKGDGSLATATVTVPPQGRRTVLSSAIAALSGTGFATVVESDQPVVVDRTMYWSSAQYGSHTETAVTQPRLRWYLAEGATHSGFDLFYLLQNAGAQDAEVRVTYLRPAGLAPLIKTYRVAARSRFNIWVNIEQFDGLGQALASTDLSAVIDVVNDAPIIVERAMYLTRAGQQFAAGHESAAVPAPAVDWFLAEGATGQYFDLFILVANPGPVDAPVEVRYLLADGRTFTKQHIVPASSRYNIWVDEEDIGGVKALADVAVSTTIKSINAVPLIVERAMWWPGPTAATWHEAHNSPGATTTGLRWALADGAVGGPTNAETYVLIANTSAVAGEAKVTVLHEDGSAPEARTFALLPSSRSNVSVAAEFPSTVGRRFAVLVESLGTSPAALVVERAMYGDSNALAARFGAATTLSCANEPTTMSASGALFEFEVVNNGTVALDVFWKNFVGVRVKYGTVLPGETWSVGSYAGHAWLLADAAGTCVGLFRMPSGSASAMVGPPAQHWASGSNALATQLP